MQYRSSNFSIVAFLSTTLFSCLVSIAIALAKRVWTRLTFIFKFFAFFSQLPGLLVLFFLQILDVKEAALYMQDGIQLRQ